MQYVTGPGVAPDYFGVGKGGWQNGDPTAGIQGTVLDAALLNDVLGNLMHVLTAGGVAPTPGRLDDLKDAIVQLSSPMLHGQCQLRRVSNVALSIVPYGGQYVRIDGRSYALPVGGIPASTGPVMVSGVGGANLAASTTYLLFVKDDGAGNVIPDFWPVAVGHMADTTGGNVGVEVRSNGGLPDSTRTLVGMVATDAGTHFQDTDGSRLVLSWFNRRAKKSRTTFSSAASTGSGSPVELSTSIRCSFLTWADEPVEYRVTGSVSAGASGQLAMTGIGFDGTVPALEAAVFSGMHTSTEGSSTAGMANFGGVEDGLSEGRHYATLLGAAAGGISAWTGGTTPIGSFPPCVLDITVRG